MKIGIVSHYYNSTNYGGNLQAYALCEILRRMGYDSEQICFPFYKNPHIKMKIMDKLSIRIKETIVYSIDWIKHPVYHNKLRIRKKAMIKFRNELIPHSKEIFTMKTLSDAIDDYQIFITGSDIVWGPKVHSPFFFLNFVPSEIPKFSYAASLGTNELTEKEKEEFKRDLSGYQDISVREVTVVPMLAEVLQRKISLCVDPTLLFSKKEWNNICSDKIVKDKYLFCYFLGDNENAVKSAIMFAALHNLKVVNIPYLSKFYKNNSNFGDVKLANISPSDFLSLIKHSECVFTDSFHACVFSFIYSKNVFAFRRSKTDDLGVRLKDFMSLIDAVDHYCDCEEKEQLSYIEAISSNIVYKKNNDEIKELINYSMEYLKQNINQAIKIL